MAITTEEKQFIAAMKTEPLSIAAQVSESVSPYSASIARFKTRETYYQDGNGAHRVVFHFDDGSFAEFGAKYVLNQIGAAS